MGKIYVWSGQHSGEIRELIKQVYLSESDLLVLCPPRVKDVSDWLPILPSGEVEFRGELAHLPPTRHTGPAVYPVPPKFGLFSTGTENGAKLILFTNENFEASVRGIFSFFEDLSVHTIYCYPRPYHVFGLALGYLASLILGKELIVTDGAYSKADHLQWLATCEARGPGLLTLGTPTHFSDAHSYFLGAGRSIPQSLTCIVGGAQVNLTLWQMLKAHLNISLPSVGYGCTEASPGVTHLAPGLVPRADGDLGVVLPGGSLVEKEGRYYYRGANVCLAIVHEHELRFPDSEVELADSLRAENGHFFFAHRQGLVLNRGGEKFSLEEIEGLLLSQLELKSIALALEHPRLGQELGLVVEGSDESLAPVLELLQRTYQRQFSEENFLGLASLPLNANAKVDRSLARRLLQEKLS